MEVCRLPVFETMELDVGTPVLAIDLDRLAGSARAIASRHAEAHMRWCPTTLTAGVPSASKLLQDLGAAGVSVGGVSQAAAAVSAGFGAVTVEIPPVILGQPRRYAELCRKALLTVVCDHFAQAELIADACRDAQVESQVLLRVDVGLQRLGVRPGPDLSDLAEGVRRLRGVRATGVWIGGSPAGIGVGRLQGSELSRLFERCQVSLSRAGCEMTTLSVSSLEQLGRDPFLPMETRTPVPEEHQTAFVLAGVVARPTRDQAVVDAGRGYLGSSARAIGPPDATQVTHIDDDFAVLRLTPDRQDFAIGDIVTLIPEVPMKLRTGEPVLVGHNGAWRSEHVY